MWCLDAVDRPKCKKAWAQNLGTWSNGAVRLNTAAGDCSVEGAKGTEAAQEAGEVEKPGGGVDQGEH